MRWTRVAMLLLMGCSSEIDASVSGYWITTSVESDVPEVCERFDPETIGWAERDFVATELAAKQGAVVLRFFERASAMVRSSGAATELVVDGDAWELVVVTGTWSNPNECCVEPDTLDCVGASSTPSVVCVLRGNLSGSPRDAR